MKKGQIEMIGLMIIVILIIFVGLLFLRLKGAEADRPDVMEAARTNIKASNFMNALMKLSMSEGCDEQFEDLAEECAEDDTTMVCGKDCNFIEDTVEDLAGAILDRGECYEFSYGKDKDNLDVTMVRPNTAKRKCNVDCQNAKIVDAYRLPDMYARVRLWKSCTVT